MNIGEVVTRISGLARLLNNRTASSFYDRHEVYLILTELALEVQNGRKLIDDGSCEVLNTDDGLATVVHIMERKK